MWWNFFLSLFLFWMTQSQNDKSRTEREHTCIMAKVMHRVRTEKDKRERKGVDAWPHENWSKYGFVVRNITSNQKDRSVQRSQRQMLVTVAFGCRKIEIENEISKKHAIQQTHKWHFCNTTNAGHRSVCHSIMLEIDAETFGKCLKAIFARKFDFFLKWKNCCEEAQKCSFFNKFHQICER